MIGVRENEKYVLQNGDKELLEEEARRSLIRYFSHVVHELVAHAKAGVLDLTVVVLAGPHAGINHELELTAVKFEKSGEAIQVDGLEQLEELDTVFRVFREVFIDHFERAFEDVLHDCGNFVFHQTLSVISIEPGSLVEKSDRESRGVDGPTYMKFGDDRGYYIQDLCITCIWDVAVVVAQHCFQQRRYKIVVDRFQIISL